MRALNMKAVVLNKDALGEYYGGEENAKEKCLAVGGFWPNNEILNFIHRGRTDSPNNSQFAFYGNDSSLCFMFQKTKK